jgi:hypothetical protein
MPGIPRYINNREENEEEKKTDYMRKNMGQRAESSDYLRDSNKKYQTMYNKSFELMKAISDMIPDEEAKIKGDSSYYYNRDKDYDKIVEKQKLVLFQEIF